MDMALHSNVDVNWNETIYLNEKLFQELWTFFSDPSKITSSLEKFYQKEFGMTWDSLMHFLNATQHMDFTK